MIEPNNNNVDDPFSFTKHLPTRPHQSDCSSDDQSDHVIVRMVRYVSYSPYDTVCDDELETIVEEENEVEENNSLLSNIGGLRFELFFIF